MPIGHGLPKYAPPFTVMAAGLAVVAGLYYLALPGYWLFDDWANLVPLNEIDDLNSALSFVLSGQAGPLGRPISLATFALQADAWDQHPEVMIATNIAIHMSAMAAVFFLAAGLARVRLPHDHPRAWWIGAFAAVLWALAPFLASTHLMPIQRMTSLSGLFVFTGLALFVWSHAVRGHTTSRIFLVVGVGLGTLLAAYSKENGALLPLLGLLILALWIPRDVRLSTTLDTILILALIIAPSLLLLGYLGVNFVETLLRGDYGARRDFSVTERLITQPIILWDYVRNLLLPRAISATPFMDYIPAARGLLDPSKALLALLLWGTTIIVAVIARKRAPWFLFGLSFFVIAHVLESSYIGLELYFSHRNYVPAFGLFFGLVFFAFTIRPGRIRLPLALLTIYTFLFAMVLSQVTGSWNDKLVNGKLWLEHNPDSVRAHQFLSHTHIENRNFIEARRVLDQAVDRHPEHDLLQLQRTENCVGREEEFGDLLREVTEVLRASKRYQSNVTIDLRQAAQKSTPTPLCPPRTHNVLIHLADTLLANPTYADHDFARAQLLLVKAFSNGALGHDKKELGYFHHFLRIRPDLDIAFRALSLQANMGDYDNAMAFLDELQEAGPERAIETPVWTSRIEHFREILIESRRIDEGVQDDKT